MADEAYICEGTTFGQCTQFQKQDVHLQDVENPKQDQDGPSPRGKVTFKTRYHKSDTDKLVQEIHPLISTSSVGQFPYNQPQVIHYVTGQQTLTPFSMDNGQLSCVQPQGRQPTNVYMPPNPPKAEPATPANDFLWLSACACCCCWLIGPCAIHSTRKAVDANYKGDIRSAKMYGSRAKCISIIAIVVGIIVIVLDILLFIFKIEQ